MKMTLAHTDVPAVSLQYLLGRIHPWLHSIKESKCLCKYLAQVDESEASKLSSLLRKLSQDLLKVPTPPLSLIPIYKRDPSKVLEKLLETLGEERLKQHQVYISAQSTGTAQETYSTMLAMKDSLIENGLQECTFEVENIGRVKIVSALQRVINHVIIRTNGFPLGELGAQSSTVDGMAWIEKTTELLSKLPIDKNLEKQDDNVYLREVNGASLMLEIAENLESSEDVLLNKANLVKCDNTGSSSLDALELLKSYISLVEERAISLECEPRPFSYRLVDGGPDQKQSHLPTKITAAIEFRTEMNAHACIQRRAQRDSVANEAERGNSILGRAATVGSSISNSTFKTSEDCLKKFERDLEERSIKPEVTNLKKLAASLGEDFTAEMNMWYGANELANRWNGFPCFGQTIFAKTPLSFYQLPLSHLLEADIQAYSKASKKEKDKEERFDWIRLNLEWYDTHGYISPSGYYEERRACNNPTCCGKRMLPLACPQTPKPSIFKFMHYEESRQVHKILEEEGLNEKLAGLNLFPEISVDEDGYRRMDYFLPSKALETVFNQRHGLKEKEMQDFRKVFPCPNESLKDEMKKLLEKEKQREREKLPIPMSQQMSPDNLYCEKTPRLTETLREICNCSDLERPWRVTGVKYDLVSRIMEHAHDTPIIVDKEIQKLDRVCVEKELKNTHSLPTSGTLQDIKERLARARLKKWLPPKSPQAPQGSNCNDTGLTEDFILISSVINTMTDSS